jgi:hypothetical protein
MFGFGGKRKKYNGTIDIKLNNEYQICTDRGINPHFPGVIKYYELMDSTWSEGMNADEAALYIAVLYWASLFENGKKSEASPVRARIEAVGKFGVEKGMISRKWGDKFFSAIETVTAKFDG